MAAKAAEPAEEKEEVVRGGEDAHLGQLTDSHFMIYSISLSGQTCS